MKTLIARFVREDKGQDLIEYALIATVVSMGAYVGGKALGTALNNWYGSMANSVNNAAGNIPSL